jgi:hypothetical protein
MTKPKSTTDWIKHVDPDDVATAYDEATTDAYGDHEQHTGLLTAIEDELCFPFKAKVIGQPVKIVGMQWPDDDEFGLDMIVENDDGRQYPVATRSVEILRPFPDGIQYLAAYLDWRRRF